MTTKEYFDYLLYGLPVDVVLKTRTVAMVKQDFMNEKEAIIQEIIKREFNIEFAAEVTFTQDLARAFYIELNNKERQNVYAHTIDIMTQGPSLFMVLEKERENSECWGNWRYEMGVTNPIKASTDSLRHIFFTKVCGEDESLFSDFIKTNVLHGSSCGAAVYREAMLMLLHLISIKKEPLFTNIAA